MQTRNCCAERNKPSGHAGHYEPFSPCNYATPRQVNFDLGEASLKRTLPDDFAGPYKDFNPPGWREPAVGEQEWGDVPYLPSYKDEAHQKRILPAGKGDNLFFRGPFFNGVSETHEKFVNRRGIEPKKYHKYVRHYEEPGMKYDKSITQTDFGPPYPMTAKGKNPCLEEQPKERSYKPVLPKFKNPHAKELESKCREPDVVFIDEEPIRNFSTEYNDNYVCFQRPKSRNKLMDPEPSPSEIFQHNLRKSHCECPYDVPYSLVDATITCCPIVGRQDGDNLPERTPWLVSPKCQSTCNELLILPSKCICK